MTKLESRRIDFKNDTHIDKNLLTKPIFDACVNIDGKFDGMLVYNCQSKSIVLSGIHTKKIKEKIKINL